MTNHNFVWLVKHAVSYSHEVTPGKPKPSPNRISQQPEGLLLPTTSTPQAFKFNNPNQIKYWRCQGRSIFGGRSSDKEEDGAFKYWLDPTMGLWLTSMQQQGDTENPKQSTAQYKLFKNEKWIFEGDLQADGVLVQLEIFRGVHLILKYYVTSSSLAITPQKRHDKSHTIQFRVGFFPPCIFRIYSK